MTNKKQFPGRYEPECWGLQVLQSKARQEDKRKCDGDSVLLLRQMYITWLAMESGSLVDYFLEHPEDPMDCSYSAYRWICASIWITQAVRMWLVQMGAVLSKFDQ